MRQTRLSFLTARILIEKGGAKAFLSDLDFSEPFDAINESMCYQFLIESFERQLSHLKKREFYEDKLQNLP